MLKKKPQIKVKITRSQQRYLIKGIRDLLKLGKLAEVIGLKQFIKPYRAII